MQRSPYSRETTDISDQELRQILDSENISGLPAPYCLVPHYDGQVPLPPNTLWTAPSQSQHQQPQSMTQNTGSAQTGTERQSNNNTTPASGAGAQRTSSLTSGTGETTRRRTRTTLTPYQLRVLFRVWERTQYPSSDLRFRLATNLMMTPRNVQIWFQNQRQKTKERAEMRRRTHSPSSHATTIQRQPPRPLHQHTPHQQMTLNAGYPAAIPGMSPPESPFRYSHGPPPPPPAIPPPTAHYMTASSLPLRHALHYHETIASQNASPVSGTFAMASPPTLYPLGFSQQQSRPPMAPYHQSRPLQQSSHALPPPQHAQRGFQHLHHQRHASQPHVPPYYEDRSAPSAFTSSERSLSERGSESTQTLRIMPPPAPAAVTLTAEQHRSQLRSTPSPLASGSLAPFMSSLSMESPRSALRTAPPAEHNISPANRGVQLAEILNPVAVVGSASSSPEKLAAVSDSEAKSVDSQSGPLPSLGAVLANVQSDSPSADTPRDTCAPATPAPLGSSEAAATATAGDKWRPW
ncbi:hypothetical protein H4S00_002132 [Coemansia sp. D1744]|nr:hypothetical protein H4S00_002132 [Coemansia sp. D1744]